MKLSSILNKRNYEYAFYRFKRFPKSIKTRSEFLEVLTIQELLDLININDYDKIVAVSSGPSSSNLILENRTLYFSTNASIELIKNHPCIYSVNDSYYLEKYMKTCHKHKGIVAMLSWYYATPQNLLNPSLVRFKKFLSKYQRDYPELLISNEENKSTNHQLFKEISLLLKNEFNFSFYGVNSGFVLTVLAFVIAYCSKKELEIYGLDMGNGSRAYFNSKSHKVGHSVNSLNSRSIVNNFFQKINDQNRIAITNHSFFP